MCPNYRRHLKGAYPNTHICARTGQVARCYDLLEFCPLRKLRPVSPLDTRPPRRDGERRAG